MQVTQINTSRNYMQRTMQQQISQASNELISGKRSIFKNSTDIIVGNISSTNHLLYNSSMQGLESVTTLLKITNEYLNEMSNATQELNNLFIQASTQNLPQRTLADLDTQFQSQLSKLNKIAANASVDSFTPLNGSIDETNPLNINTPTGDIISIALKNMTNEASPIGAPADGDLQIELPSNIVAFRSTVDPTIAGNSEDTLSSIKNFCGQNSFLYIVAKKIKEGLGDHINGNRCKTYLQNQNWNTLLSSSIDITAAQTLTHRTSTLMDTIDTVLLGGIPLNETLYDIIDQALEL